MTDHTPPRRSRNLIEAIMSRGTAQIPTGPKPETVTNEYVMVSQTGEIVTSWRTVTKDDGRPMTHAHARERPTYEEAVAAIDKLTSMNDGAGPEKGSSAYRRLGAYARIVELFDAGELPVDPLTLPSFMRRQKD